MACGAPGREKRRIPRLAGGDNVFLRLRPRRGGVWGTRAGKSRSLTHMKRGFGMSLDGLGASSDDHCIEGRGPRSFGVRRPAAFPLALTPLHMRGGCQPVSPGTLAAAFCRGPALFTRSREGLDPMSAASGEDSYGLRCFCGGFGGFLPQPPYLSGGQRRGFTFGLARP
jgi:hypothetical protein